MKYSRQNFNKIERIGCMEKYTGAGSDPNQIAEAGQTHRPAMPFRRVHVFNPEPVRNPSIELGFLESKVVRSLLTLA